MSRDFHLPGRSPVIAGEAMAATSHPLATLAAIDVLRLGGNSVDAAVTAVAVLCVIEPHMTGIGGDCFALIAEDGKPVWGYNGCGRSGAKASTEALVAKGLRVIEPTSPHAVNVPGAIGYLRIGDVDPTVKVLRIDELLPEDKGYKLRVQSELVSGN